MSGQHARLSASAAHRWMNCPGSVKLSEGLPNLTSEEAAQGTFAHQIAAACLNNGTPSSEFLGMRVRTDGHITECDQEMVEGVDSYVQYCRSDALPGDKVWNELNLAKLQSIDPDFGGTADRVRYRSTDGHLHVIDFKYGAGVVVDPDDNKQLQMYALGVMLETDEPVTKVTVTIAQPRIEHEAGRIRSWTFKASDILDYAATAIEAANITRQPNPPLVYGKEQCRFCPARRICPELEKAQHALVLADFNPATVYNPVKLSAALDLIPMVEARIKALREFAYAEAERGNPPPGYKLVDKRATRRWKNEGDVIEWAQARAVDPYAPRELKSPAQMEKMLKKPEKEAIKQFAESKSSGHTLVPATDDRPAAQLLTAEAFSVVDGTEDKTGSNPSVTNLF